MKGAACRATVRIVARNNLDEPTILSTNMMEGHGFPLASRIANEWTVTICIRRRF